MAKISEKIEWIPIGDSLPRSRKIVFVFTARGLVGEAYTYSGQWFWRTDNTVVAEGLITHWAQYPRGPQPPEER